MLAMTSEATSNHSAMSGTRLMRVFSALATTGSILTALPAFSAVDFESEVRPLLREHCWECHGSQKQKGGLRLDSLKAMMAGGESGPAIEVGGAARSRVIERISSQSEDERMPPKGRALSPQEISVLQSWIDSGAAWPAGAVDADSSVDKRASHWSVQPIKRDWPQGTAIDTFIGSALNGSGLDWSPEADRRTLIRRLSFDLLGLPPEAARVEAFVTDSRADAYPALVDEFLSSPRYGERWARHWLDIAHYADTHGFERDQLRPNAWRYRDYVIKALNEDKPYDVFLRQQIAGDIIEPKNPEAHIATGFLAAGPWDFVGHVETKSEQLRRAARAGDLDDMVTQVMTATTAITINCARCHDHKLDPISQEEYYRLCAVFAGVKRGERDADPAEAMRIGSLRKQIEAELKSVRAEAAALSGEPLDLADMIGGGDGRGTGVRGRGIHPRTGNFVTDKTGFHPDILTNRLQKPAAPADSQNVLGLVQAVFVPDGSKPLPVTFKQEVQGVPATSGNAWDAVRNGPLNGQVSTKINEINYAAAPHSILGLHANAGVTFDLERIRETSGGRTFELRLVVGFGANPGAANTLADFSIYAGTELVFQKLKLKKSDFAEVAILIPQKAKTLTFIATDGGDGIGSDLLFLGDARLHPADAKGSLTEIEARRLSELRGRISALQMERDRLPAPERVYAVTAEAVPPTTHVYHRGNAEDPRQPVMPGTIAWCGKADTEFGSDQTDEGERRRRLAEWITSDRNPLTARVIVNRFWHYHFGQGLVRTPSDFGLGGDTPSHPELLDWLAARLSREGWSLKAVHRLILNSRAYKQASASHERGAALDAQNRLIWRQNPRRLDAESLHDAVLFASGKLNLAMGGPGYRDFKYTEAYAPIYEYTTPSAPELWRRSIYRFVVRTTPHRFMTTLDCPDPANLTPVRAQTTTALQALTLSNNPFMLEQAAHLADRVRQGAASDAEAVQRAFRFCLARVATESESAAALALVRAHGMRELCRVLFNTNEFSYVD